MKKEEKYKITLESAKYALDSINMPFHLHAGTSLGAHREHAFIKHDNDIDLAVFSKDANTLRKVNLIVKAMEENGFYVSSVFGKVERGYEIQFVYDKYGVSLDIFWVYKSKYKNKEYNILSSYLGICDRLKHKACVWGYRPYKTEKIMFYNKEYNIVPKYTLEDMYGENWKIPKKFGYFEGLNEGGYKGLIADFYEPKNNDTQIAYCFLLKEYQKHSKIWVNFFNEDIYSSKSYNIYSHIKNVTDKTQPWLLKNKVKTISTAWCEESLVKAFVLMLIKAYENPKNKYFCLLSDECIPLFDYWKTYKKITSTEKSRLHIDFTAEPYINTGFYYADQWVILNRKCANLLIKLYTTKSGEKYLKYIREETERYCPDELFPINWFVYNFGKISSSSFKKEIKNVVTTFTEWNNIDSSPIKFTTPKMEKSRTKICTSDAIFARKFNNRSAKKLAQTC